MNASCSLRLNAAMLALFAAPTLCAGDLQTLPWPAQATPDPSHSGASQLASSPVAAAGDKVFPGGTLDRLKALSPTLTFNRLTITGRLKLSVGDSVLLRVKDLTITKTGSVGYQYSPCTYQPAPDFTVKASGKVVIDGDIRLIGRSGTRTLSSSTCNQPGGQAGGLVSLAANGITITGTINNSGGAGGTSVMDTSSSFGGRGGNGGAIFLDARNIILNGATLTTRGGAGGVGYNYGAQNHGPAGAPGQVNLVASALFRMTQSSVSTDGPVTLFAAKTEIFGEITGSKLDAKISGKRDTKGPQVKILTPRPGGVVQLGKPLVVRIQASDSGTGVKQLRIDGLGVSQIQSAVNMRNGILTFTIPKALPPSGFKVTAYDNQGHSTMAMVPGLRMTGNLTIAKDETLVLEHDLLLGPEASLSVAGKLVIKHGTDHLIQARALHVTATGRITDEDTGPEVVHDKAPSLAIHLWGTAAIDGTIDLSGNTGWPYYTDDGGDLTIDAGSIAVAGTLKADGAHASEAGSGANGGAINLTSSLALNMTGTLSAEGSYGNDYRGGNGGDIRLSYVTTVTLWQGNPLDYLLHVHISAGNGWRGSGTDGTFVTTRIGQSDITIEQPAGVQLANGSGVIGFGSTEIHSTGATRTFTLRNAGTRSLTRIHATLAGEDFTLGKGLAGSSLAPGESILFTVTFSPVAGGKRSALLHVWSNDSDENPFRITVSGVGVTAPEIVVEQPVHIPLKDNMSALSFGTVAVGKALTRTFTIRNAGSAPLTKLAVAINGTHARDFTAGKPIKASLAPGASTSFKVTFKPRAAGARTAAIHIRSNDTDENPFDIKLTGRASSQAAKLAAAANQPSSMMNPAESRQPRIPWITSTLRLPDGTRYRTLSVVHPPADLSDTHRVEVSANLVDWLSGRCHTTVVRNDRALFQVRDNTPLTPGAKRHIRIRSKRP